MKGWTAVFIAGIFLAACGDSGPEMQPGTDCMACHAHSPGSHHGWTVAGTVFASPTANTTQGVDGVTVLITDATGQTVTLVSNAAGNFYTNKPLTLPFEKVSVQHNGQTLTMPTAGTSGACNSCHTLTGQALARLYAP